MYYIELYTKDLFLGGEPLSKTKDKFLSDEPLP